LVTNALKFAFGATCTAKTRMMTWSKKTFWKAPRILELPVGMEINMYACATSSLQNS